MFIALLFLRVSLFPHSLHNTINLLIYFVCILTLVSCPPHRLENAVEREKERVKKAKEEEEEEEEKSRIGKGRGREERGREGRKVILKSWNQDEQSYLV